MKRRGFFASLLASLGILSAKEQSSDCFVVRASSKSSTVHTVYAFSCRASRAAAQESAKLRCQAFLDDPQTEWKAEVVEGQQCIINGSPAYWDRRANG